MQKKQAGLSVRLVVAIGIGTAGAGLPRYGNGGAGSIIRFAKTRDPNMGHFTLQ